MKLYTKLLIATLPAVALSGCVVETAPLFILIAIIIM